MEIIIIERPSEGSGRASGFSHQLSEAVFIRWRCVFSIFEAAASGFSRQAVSPDDFTAGARRSDGNGSAAAAALDVLFGFQCFHPLKSSKHRNIHDFRQLAAYLRRSADLYLAASGCIVLFLRWAWRYFL